MPDPQQPSVALCILSWRNHATLIRSLESYRAGGLFDQFDERLIFFQEIGAAERDIAERFQLSCTGSYENLGIAGGWQAALASLSSDLVLMLEQDCPLVEDQAKVKQQLALAMRTLNQGSAQVFRLRSRRQPGSKFYNVEKYLRYYPPEDSRLSARTAAWLRRTLRPAKAERLLGSAVYCGPQAIASHSQISTPEAGLQIVSSRHLNWTNQSVMFHRRWMLEVLLKRVECHPANRTINGFQDIEMALNSPWWRQQDFRIGVSDGLFTHL